MANAPLDLIEILIAASGATESQFTAEHPHPLLLPEKVRSGLLRRLQEEGGTGTLGWARVSRARVRGSLRTTSTWPEWSP